MNQLTVQPFPVLVQKFFMQRLQEQRHVSPRTVMAYRDSFRLLLAFAYQRLHKRPAEITIQDLSAPFVLEFLRHLEQDRRNAIRSRNARFAAIRSFMEYVSFEEPSALAIAQSVLAIPMSALSSPSSDLSPGSISKPSSLRRTPPRGRGSVTTSCWQPCITPAHAFPNFWKCVGPIWYSGPPHGYASTARAARNARFHYGPTLPRNSGIGCGSIRVIFTNRCFPVDLATR